MRRGHGIIIGLLILAIGLGVRYFDPKPLERLRLEVFSVYQQLQPRRYEPAPVRIVDVGEDSLRRFGQWPWPRPLIADLVTRLQDAGAATVVLNILLAEADRTSPQQLAKSLSSDREREAFLKALQAVDLPDHDETLAQAIGRGGVVTVFLPAETPSSTPHRQAGLAFVGGDPLVFAPQFQGAIVNLPILEQAAAGNGALTVFPDLDGVVHRLPLVVGIAGQLYPSLAVDSLRVAQGAGTLMVKSSSEREIASYGESNGIKGVKVGAFEAPTDSAGQLWLYDTGPIAERHIPAWQVLEPGFDAARVAGNIVIVGVAAAGLSDARVTPLNPEATGAVLNALAMEQVLLQVFLTRPLWSTGAELAFLFALGLVLSTAFVSARLGAVTSTFLGALLVIAGLGVSWWAFTRHGLLLDPVYPVLVGSVIYLSNALIKYMISESQRKEVRTAFSQYVAPALVDELARNPGALKLGGERREMSILFCDVRNFTNISESLEPEALTHLLNRFLTDMSNEILSRRGTIDKYMGDAVMAFWNAPLPEPEHARQACATALAMVAGLPRFNEELKSDALYGDFDFGRFRCGIGINTGPCLVGNIGSDQRFDYSVLGNTVNLASRVEGQCKTYGVAIIVGDSTREAAPEFAALELDLIRVRGKRNAARIHALLGDPEVAGSPAFTGLAAAHEAMLAAYRGQHWAAAKASTEQCRALATDWDLDLLYDEYERRIAVFAADPPDADWDGIYVAQTK